MGSKKKSPRKRKVKRKNIKTKTIEFTCAVPGCRYRYTRYITRVKQSKRLQADRISQIENKDLQYYLFPCTTEWCEKWLLAINPDKPEYTPYDWRVCGIHFEKSNFLPKFPKKLKISAVPSLELGNTSNENPKLLSIGTNEAVKLVINDINFLHPKIIKKGKNSNQKNIVTSSIPSCSVPHCRLSLADGVKLFNLPKVSSGRVRITNKEGQPEVMDIRSAWIKLAGILVDPLSNTANIKICSEHFLPTQIMIKKTDKGIIRKLQKCVLPSLRLTSNTKGVNNENDSSEEDIDDEINSERRDQIPEYSPQENRQTEKKTNKMPKKVVNSTIKILPINFANEKLEVFDGQVPPPLFITNDDGNEPITSYILPDIHQFTEEITAPYLVPKLKAMEVDTQEEIMETKFASLDIVDLCRVCACYSIDAILIFSEEGYKLQLQRKIQQYLNITVNELETEMPQGVCVLCVNKLYECEQLQERASHVDKEFRQVLDRKHAFVLENQSEQNESLIEEIQEDIDANVTIKYKGHISKLKHPQLKYDNENSRNFLRNVVHYPQDHDYPCDICKQPLGTLPNLVEHLKIHGKVLCPMCCELCLSYEDFFEHMSDIHFTLCIFCDVKFGTRQMLKFHIDLDHKDKIPVCIKVAMGSHGGGYCKICDKLKLSMRTLKAHYFWEHYFFACDICYQLFKTSDEQVKHTEEVHTIPCPYCFVNSYSYHRFKRHLNTHMSQSSKKIKIPKLSEQIYECKFCYKGLSNKENVKRHNFWCHLQFTCMICLASFSNKELEAQHFKTHGHVCIICESKFETKNELKYHMSESHPNSLPFMCDNCGEKLKTRKELNEHITSTHEKKKIHLCDTCGKSFTIKNSLTGHIRKEHSTKLNTVKCNFCFKIFKSKANIRAHMITSHISCNKFKCLDCKLSFSTAKALNKHMVKHSFYNIRELKIKCHLCNFKCTKREMPFHIGISHSDSFVYKCNVCNKYLVQENDMACHIQGHSNNELASYAEPYQEVFAFLCDICNQYFVNKINLQSHMKIHYRPTNKKYKKARNRLYVHAQYL